MAVTSVSPLEDACFCGYLLVNNKDSLVQGLERIVKASAVPGICVATSIEGVRTAFSVGVTSAQHRSPISDDTEFEIGCLSSALLAAVTLENAWKGLVDVDVPIETYLPELRLSTVGRTVSIRNLLSHSGGYCGINLAATQQRHSQVSWEELAEFCRNARQLFKPGTVFSHEHSGSALLGEILRRVSGRAAPELIQDLILDHLAERRGDQGLLRTPAIGHVPSADKRHFVVKGAGPLASEVWKRAGGSIALTVGELLSVAELLADIPRSFPMAEKAALSTKTTNEMRAMSLAVPTVWSGRRARLFPCAFGLGLAGYQSGFIGQDGTVEGQVVSLRVNRERKIAIAIALNARAVSLKAAIMDAVIRSIGQDTDGQCSSIPEPESFDSRELFGDYIGNDGCTASFSKVGNGIWTTITAGPTVETIMVQVSVHGRVSTHGSGLEIGMAFFRDPTTGDPCLMLGSNALRRNC